MRFVRTTARLAGQSLTHLVLGSLLVAALIFTATVGHVWAHARSDSTKPADVIFVLGAAQYNGRPSNWLAARLDHAAELYKQGVAPTIVTVGGKRDGDQYTEAEAGKNYLVSKHGVDASNIVEIGQGTDTLTSVDALRSTLEGKKTVMVVTDPNHTLRAVKMVEDHGFSALSSPTRSGPSVSTRGEQASSLLHESMGLLYYQLFEQEV